MACIAQYIVVEIYMIGFYTYSYIQMIAIVDQVIIYY